MTTVTTSPAFGQADLSNCERELIHLAGSVQPHGVLLTLREPGLDIVQASANAAALIGRDAATLVGCRLDELGGDAQARVRSVLERPGTPGLDEPEALRCRIEVRGRPREFEGTLHRMNGLLVAELEPIDPEPGPAFVETVDVPPDRLQAALGEAVQRFSAASTLGILADAAVQTFRDLLGYQRVMVYQFDPEGHGKIIAEARDPRLDSLLGHHYPASDIPERARMLYLRTRLRVLADVRYQAAELLPRRLPDSGEELDMSLCHLRSMSPLHLQYLKNMDVTATLVVSLVREGRLWGLVACHHHEPRKLRFAVRTACELLAEVLATRIAAIENYVHAQVAIQVRRLEQRLVEATSTEGDWRVALFRNPRTLLQPLDASGAALFYEGDLLTAGETPGGAELRELLRWIERNRTQDAVYSCASIERANPSLDSLTPTASGIVAVRLSAGRPDYLMWFRKEQLHTVTWAGDPSKPMVDNDPLKLSPRRSFAAWSEIVRGTALPWSAAEIALARAFAGTLTDIMVQVNAVRLLIAEHQLTQIRGAVANASEAVVIADAQQRALFANGAFLALRRASGVSASAASATATSGASAASPEPAAEASQPADNDDASLARLPATQLFTRPDLAQKILDSVAAERQPWRGELEMILSEGRTLPVGLRVELVPARDGSALGYFLIFSDLSDAQRAADARRHLEQSLSATVRQASSLRALSDGPIDESDVIGAILANASLAAMDITDANAGPTVAPLLEELEASTKRAAALYDRVKAFGA